MYGYARYLHPIDSDRPRGGTLVSRIVRTLCDAGLATELVATDSSVILAPAGRLAAYCERAGIFDPRLRVAVFGEPRTFCDPFVEDGVRQQFCPGCDLVAAKDMGTPAGPRHCPDCREPYDADLWPTMALAVAFEARVVVALTTSTYAEVGDALSVGCPSLLSAVESVLGGPVVETLIAAKKGAAAGAQRSQRWCKTDRGFAPAIPDDDAFERRRRTRGFEAARAPMRLRPRRLRPGGDRTHSQA